MASIIIPSVRDATHYNPAGIYLVRPEQNQEDKNSPLNPESTPPPNTDIRILKLTLDVKKGFNGDTAYTTSLCVNPTITYMPYAIPCRARVVFIIYAGVALRT